jgi:hypothetical protein
MHSSGRPLQPNMAPGSPLTGITSYTCRSSGHKFVTLPRQGYARNAASPASTNMHPGCPSLQQNPLPQVNAYASGTTTVPPTDSDTSTGTVCQHPSIIRCRTYQTVVCPTKGAGDITFERYRRESVPTPPSRVVWPLTTKQDHDYGCNSFGHHRLIGNRSRCRPRTGQEKHHCIPSKGKRRRR